MKDFDIRWIWIDCLGDVYVLFTGVSIVWRFEYYREVIQTQTKEKFVEK